MEREAQARRYLTFVNSNYDKYKKKWAKYLYDRKVEFDEDVFSDTILKVYDYISKNGIKDDTDDGFANYWFKAFQMNIRREQLYSRNAYRDANVDASMELDTKENGDEELQKKLRLETYTDFSLLYMFEKVEKEFDVITFWCFRLYYLINKMSYSRLKDITKVKDCKKRVVSAKKWLAENVTKEELDKAFQEWYDK